MSPIFMRFLCLRQCRTTVLIALLTALGLAAASGCEARVLDPFPLENADLNCTTHGDCALPAAFCNDANGRCVECRDDYDCDRGACDRLTHTCRRSCSINDDCEGSRRRLCERTRGICVECSSDAHCHVGLAICRDDACIECMQDGDCGEGDERHCQTERNRCRECLEDHHCPDGMHCDDDELRCESNSR
jgi:hypothetical protein